MALGPDEKEWVRQYVANAIGYRIYARSSSSGHGDAVESHALAPEDPSARSEVRRMETWGVRSVPPAGTEACVVFVNGGPSNGIVVACGSDKYGPDDLADGELAIYCAASGSVITLKNTGEISIAAGAGITITAAVGQNVTVNGGKNNVARAAVDTAGPYPISGGALFFKG